MYCHCLLPSETRYKQTVYAVVRLQPFCPQFVDMTMGDIIGIREDKPSGSHECPQSSKLCQSIEQIFEQIFHEIGEKFDPYWRQQIKVMVSLKSLGFILRGP